MIAPSSPPVLTRTHPRFLGSAPSVGYRAAPAVYGSAGARAPEPLGVKQVRCGHARGPCKGWRFGGGLTLGHKKPRPFAAGALEGGTVSHLTRLSIRASDETALKIADSLSHESAPRRLFTTGFSHETESLMRLLLALSAQFCSCSLTNTRATARWPICSNSCC
jgi:hypothetical protein